MWSDCAALLCAYNSRLMNNWVHHSTPLGPPPLSGLGKLRQMSGLALALVLGLGLVLGV